jgi:hypothetical protein
MTSGDQPPAVSGVLRIPIPNQTAIALLDVTSEKEPHHLDVQRTGHLLHRRRHRWRLHCHIPNHTPFTTTTPTSKQIPKPHIRILIATRTSHTTAPTAPTATPTLTPTPCSNITLPLPLLPPPSLILRPPKMDTRKVRTMLPLAPSILPNPKSYPKPPPLTGKHSSLEFPTFSVPVDRSGLVLENPSSGVESSETVVEDVSLCRSIQVV